MPESLSAAARPTGDPLALRRHIDAIADLGRKALEGGVLEDLFDEACELVARALAIEYVGLVEDLGDTLQLRSQFGWPEPLMLPDRISRRSPSQAAYTLDTCEAVVLDDPAAETRFQVAEAIREFGIVSGISVPIVGRGRPFGVLAAHSPARRSFSEDEVVFLRLLANVLAAGVDARRAAETASAREQLLGSLVEHGPDIVIRFDSALRHLYVSPAVELATGTPPEAFIGKTNAELGMAQELCELWERELRPVFETGEPRRFEFEFPSPAGPRWLESHAVAEPGQDGVVESIIAFTRDRTEAHDADLRYRELFELATELIFLWDADGRCIDANPAAERALGYTRDELIGRHFTDVVAPESRAAVTAELRDKLERPGSTNVFESAVAARCGRAIPVQTTSRSVVRAGRTVGVLAMSRDISEEKAAAAALTASEQLFRGAFYDVAVGMLVTTPEGAIVSVNAAFERMLGYEPGELAGKTIADTTHPDDIEATRVFIEQLVAGTEDTHRGEKRYRTKDGETVICAVGLSAVRADDGAVPYLVAQVEDVTELRRVQAELQESQTLHEVVVESSRDLLTVLDLDGTIRLVSRSVEDILGYDRDGLIGTNFTRLVHPDDLGSAETAFAELGTNATVTMTEVRVLHSDGSWRVLEGKASPGIGADGNPAFFVTSSRDVTDRLWLEEQLRQSQKMEAIGKLAGGIAHDFNNLLTVINGYSDIALATLPPEIGDTRHGIEEIRRAGERAAELTQQLLAFSRRQVLRPEPVDLNEVVDGYLTMLERLVGEDVAVRTELDRALAPVLADPGQLGQVLLNLVVNARDAMPDGGELLIATTASDGGAALTVADTGHGMDDDVRARIFEPFFTTKEPGKGTGMGLSTVLGIVEQSGGSIAVESSPGRGATFRVQLAAAPCAVPRPEPPADLPAQETGRVLLVEDEPLVRGIVEEMLGALGHSVIATAGPGAALDAAAAGAAFDLVVTDVVMPEMNGHELASRLAELRPGVRVLYISGYTGDAVETRGVLDAGDSFLQKPFTVDALAAKVRSALTARA